MVNSVRVKCVKTFQIDISIACWFVPKNCTYGTTLNQYHWGRGEMALVPWRMPCSLIHDASVLSPLKPLIHYASFRMFSLSRLGGLVLLYVWFSVHLSDPS